MKEYNLYHDDESKIKDLLFGRKITVIGDTTLELDNGIILEVEANEGWGGCSAGSYSVKELNGVDNAITNVEFVCDSLDEYGENSYKIFVFTADNKTTKILEVEGDDGNGYYGTGYEIIVKIKE